MTKGIYGAFSKSTGECIYIGKSNSSIQGRWTSHKKAWKNDKPIHRQQLLTQFLHFFGNQIEWKILVDLGALDQKGWEHGGKALLEVLEREVFFQTKPIASAYIPNGWGVLRDLESNGNGYPISEWNPYSIGIRVQKGKFAKFSDDKPHFINPRIPEQV